MFSITNTPLSVSKGTPKTDATSENSKFAQVQFFPLLSKASGTKTDSDRQTDKEE